MMIAYVESQNALGTRNGRTIFASRVEVELFVRLGRYGSGDEQTNEKADGVLGGSHSKC
jgi:hypothetical protein